ncbi:MAG: DHH family phosphoesterase [Spirochaetia bacterium]|jgi:exopolyphosphatase|nr:DHH family phosphoesterase [Spirochaetia bacterium]
MLNNYLFDSKFNLNNKKIIHVVMGNEASDLDSMASSIVYANFLEKTSNNDNELFIPLINIPAADFKLRTEAVYLFTEAGIETNNLLFSDEINIAEIFKSGRLKITLIDHNKLSGSQEYLSGCIEEIVDHHKDENAYPVKNKTIEPVGSCATLVAEKIRAKTGKLESRESALLLAGTILLDTVNLGKEAGRTTGKDIEVIDYITDAFKIDRAKIFDRLQFEKFNTAPLSSFDILRKDYKEWVLGSKRTGFSSALISTENWLKKDPQLLDAAEKYYTKNSLDILFIMIAYTEPKFTRELILFTKDAALLENVYTYLQEKGGELAPHQARVPADKRAGFYLQGNIGWSRKKLQPVLQEYFANSFK